MPARLRIPLAIVIVAFSLLIAAAIVVAPTFSQAQGLLSCSGLDCQYCHLFKLIDNIVKFLIMVAIPVAALLFAYAGFLYFTAGGKEGNIEKAKAIFIDVVFGFILALCGFLIVDTILRTLANGSFVGPGWNTIQCVTGRQIGGPGIGFNDPNVRGLTNPGGAPSGVGVTQTPAQRGALLPGAYSSVAEAALAYQNQSTIDGPGGPTGLTSGGNLACVWAVNNVLEAAGIARIDGNVVSAMEAELQRGRGEFISDHSFARAGDIVIEEGSRHVGICLTDRCTQVISNSGTVGQTSFRGLSDSTFGALGYRSSGPGRIYRPN